jgi:hypothetical protein
MSIASRLVVVAIDSVIFYFKIASVILASRRG